MVHLRLLGERRRSHSGKRGGFREKAANLFFRWRRSTETPLREVYPYRPSQNEYRKRVPVRLHQISVIAQPRVLGRIR
jgi:hypothetical protein